MEFAYRAYGLRCVSNVPVLGFYQESRPEVPQLRIVLGSTPWHSGFAGEKLPKRVCYRKTLPVDSSDSVYTVSVLGNEEFFELAYSDGAKFVVDGAAEVVWGYCPPSMSFDYFATYLRGPIMGFVLRRRGCLALHASAVNIGDYAVILCGESQSGKSTTAAALCLRGSSVLSEDVTAIKITKNAIWAEPGYPQVGLWPDIVHSLLGSNEILPRFTATWDKRVLDLNQTPGGFDPAPRPIAAIYLLGRRLPHASAPFVHHLNARAAFLELVQNTYMNWLLTPEQRCSEFDDIARVVASVPVRRLVAHADPARLSDLCRLVVSDSRKQSISQGEPAYWR